MEVIGIMTALVCPQNPSHDVRSAQSIYDHGTEVTRSDPIGLLGRGIGFTTSIIAGKVAPPRAPQPASSAALGCSVAIAVIVLSSLGVAGLAAIRIPSVHRHTGWVLVFVGFGLLAVLLSSIIFYSRVQGRRYRAKMTTWNAQMYVWKNAMICLHCHSAFFPAGALPAGPGPGELVPIDSFHAVVVGIGARLNAVST